MTTDEVRDELARRARWEPYTASDDVTVWHRGEVAVNYEVSNHPYPPTLDGANAAVPECYHWERFNGRWFAYRGTPQKPKHVIQTGVQYGICVPDTGDPVHDLYALALACVRAEEVKR